MDGETAHPYACFLTVTEQRLQSYVIAPIYVTNMTGKFEERDVLKQVVKAPYRL